MTILHGGNQCTSSTNQDIDCTLYNKGWEFVSCRKATGVVTKNERGQLLLVKRADIKSGKAAKK